MDHTGLPLAASGVIGARMLSVASGEEWIGTH